MSYLKHIQWLPNFHELTFLESSRRACQYLLGLLTEYYYPNQTEKPQFLLDMRESGLLPLVYLSRELENLRRCYPEPSPFVFALVLDNPQNSRSCEIILSEAFRESNVSYFTEIDAARGWLLQQKPTT